MSFLYFDESKHIKHNFIVGAFIFSKYDLNLTITRMITSVGLNPEIHEFKSGLHMDSNPKQKILREQLRELIFRTKIGLLICPGNDKKFKYCVLDGLRFIMKNNNEFNDKCDIFFDEGIFQNRYQGEKLIKENSLSSKHKYHFEQDSKIIKGIQLSDLVAHTCSIMLLESLGIISKTIRITKNLSNDRSLDVKIGFEMWANVRYSFFSFPPPERDDWQSPLDCESKVEGKGLYISNLCDENIKSASLKRFGKMYLGCIN